VPETDQPGDYTAWLKVSTDTPYTPYYMPVTMSVTPPQTYGKLEGTVQGLGYCDGNPLPLYEAGILIETAMALAVADGDRPVSFNVKEWGAPAEAEPYVTYPELWLATFHHAIASPRAATYLRHRGLSDSVITALDLRYDTERDAVCFPVRDFAGDLCGLRARRIAPTDDQPRYHIYKTGTGQHNRLVWYGESWLNFDKPVVMCESVFDAASVFRVYENVCAPMTAGFTEDRAKRMRQAVEIVTLFDSDKAGDGARKRVNKFLSAAQVTHVFPPEGKKDAGEMTVTELRELLSSLLKLKQEQS
jgi:hypothetical protein